MPSDQQLQTAVTQILSGLRDQIEGALRAYGDELTRVGDAERTRAIEQATSEVRRQAQEQVVQLRDTARKQNEDLRRSAETQIADLRKLLDDIRRNAQQQIDTARQTVETEVAAARRHAEAEIEDARRVAQAQVEDVQRATDTRLAGFSRDVEEAQRELASARQQLQETEARAARQSVSASGQLAEDIASLDEAASLGDVLDRLAQAAVRHGDRVALLMVRGDRLREWRTIGFGTRAPGDRLELASADAGIAGLASTDARVVPREGHALPPFAAPANPADAAAFPITVAGAVVAVLYADVSSDATPYPRSWTADLDVLTRHAGRVLETITVQQATGVRALAHPSQPASASAGVTADTTAHPSPGSMQ